MLLSHSRVIKVKQPVKNVKLVSLFSENPHPPSIKDTQPIYKETVSLNKEQFRNKINRFYEKGFEEGKAEGYQEAMETFAQAYQSLNQIQSHLREQQEQIIQESETICLDLIFAMTTRIIKEMSVHHQANIQKIVLQTLQQSEISGKIKIKINPEEVSSIQSLEAILRQQLPDVKEVGIIGDEGITKGGCIIETDYGKLDGRIETQLKEMSNKLKKMFETLEMSGKPE